jgi:hypothetical protein
MEKLFYVRPETLDLEILTEISFLGTGNIGGATEDDWGEIEGGEGNG